MSLQALQLRLHRPACYAAPCAAEPLSQAVVFVAIVDTPQLPASSKILDRENRDKAHHEGNHNHRYGLDHDRCWGRLWLGEYGLALLGGIAVMSC